MGSLEAVAVAGLPWPGPPTAFLRRKLLSNLAKIVVVVALLLAVVLFALPTSAQQGTGPKNCLHAEAGALAAAEKAHHAPYDPATVETLTGQVTEVLLQAGPMNATGLHLLLAVGETTHEVAVGPTFYVFPEGLEVAKGDTVTVTGSQVTKTEGGNMLLARHIVVGDFELSLRDEAGIPAWRGLNPEGPGRTAADGMGKGKGEGMGMGKGMKCRHAEGMNCAEHCAAMKARRGSEGS